MARPRKELNPEQVYKLARLGCTQAEIADVLDCSVDLIQQRYSAEYRRARGDWKTSLRRAQTIRAIKDRSDNMLIHLGKSYLGQDTRKPSDEGLEDEALLDEDGKSINP